MRSQCRGGHAAHQTQARHSPVAETGRRSWFASQNHASDLAVWRGLVHAHASANAFRGGLVGPASEPVQRAVSSALSLGLRLTLRSSGPPTAWRPGREAVLFIIGCAARAPRCRRPLNLYVRPRKQPEQPDPALRARLSISGRTLRVNKPMKKAGTLVGCSTQRSGTSESTASDTPRTPPSSPRSEGRYESRCVRKLGQPSVRLAAEGRQRPSLRPYVRSQETRPPSGGFPQHQECEAQRAGPNPSVNARPNGLAPGPRGRVVHLRPRGPGTNPSVPRYLER